MKNGFAVHINSLYRAQEMLKGSCQRMSMDIEELSAIRYRLASCSEMEECIHRLEKAERDMENEMLVLRQMIKALERAGEYYPAAENKSIDYCEDMGRQRTVRYWGSNDLSNIRSSLEKLGMFEK